MTMKKKLWIILAVAGAAVALGLKWHGRESETPEFQDARVTRGDIEITIMATGVAQPQNRLEIKPPIAGRAEDILVREGESVKKGQVLAWMSSVERAALLDAARAKGPGELAHWEDLYKPTPLIAPLDGLIISRNVEPGQSVAAQDAVLVMSNRLIVKAQVDETDIGKVKPGLRARINLDAYPQENLEARVDHVAYEAKTVSNVTVYEVDVAPQRVPDFLRSGMTANVVFLAASKRDALLLPAEAVRQDDGGASVLLPNPSGKKRPISKEIQTGLTDGKKTEIVSGLSEGDTVLVRTFKMPGQAEAPQTSPFSPLGRGRAGGGGGGRAQRGR